MKPASTPKSSSASAAIAAAKSNFAKSKPTSDRKDIWTLIVEENQDDGKSDRAEAAVTVVGGWKSGKSTLIQNFINKDREDVPPPTTGLDYQIARILSEQSASNANSNSSSSEATFQFWEVGGGKQMSKMVEIGLTADNVQRAMAVIVLDLSKPSCVIADLQYWIAALKAQLSASLKQNPRAAPELLDRARLRFKQANNGEHKDLDKVELFPIPLLIIASKFDVFKDKDREGVRVMARTLRCVAHANGASLLYTSAKSKLSLQAFRIRLKSFLMQQAWPKQTTTENNDGKEQIYQAGSDFFEKIGVAPAPHDNSRNLTAGWLAAAAACFPSSGDDDDELVAPAPADGDREPLIDSVLAQKNDELARAIREAALKQRLDAVDLEK